MFKGFRSLFGSRSTEAPEESTEADVFSELRWIEAADNPFGIRVLDCRPVVLGLISTTTDPDIARRFLELRSSTGTEHFGHVPNDAIHSECDLTYPAEERPSEGPLFVAKEMEDKWNIYLYSDYLYFTRSWTGVLVSRARLMLDVGGFRSRRRTELAELGRSVAAEVSKSGEPKKLRAMSPFERKIIHDAIALAGLRSESEGEEPNRRVVVFPVG